MAGIVRTSIFITSLLLTFAGFALAADKKSQVLPQGEPGIRRLAPGALPSAPGDVVSYLLRRGYTIPQGYDVSSPHNVVRGDFDGDGFLDWVVLGTRSGLSQILVFWRGSAVNVSKLARFDDVNYLQTTGGAGGNDVGYSRRIAVVGRREIFRYRRHYGGPKPPPITHSAIEDIFVTKASSVYYYDLKKWHVLQGAD